MKNLKKQILINLQIEGIHRWADCNILEVLYLKHYHRHIFYITIQKEVKHNDRDIEIICFKNEVINWLNSNYKKDNVLFFDNMSCEDIAEKIYNHFNCSMVKVLEDNENGAIIC